MAKRSEGADAALDELLAAVRRAAAIINEDRLKEGSPEPVRNEAARFIVQHAPALIAELRQIPETGSKTAKGFGDD